MKFIPIFCLKEKFYGHCFKEKSKIVLILSNTSDHTFFLKKFLYPTTSIPVYLFETIEGSILNKNKRLQPVYKLNETVLRRQNSPSTSVIIETSSVNIFTTVLDDIRNSIWWNHAAYYLIVNRNSECDFQTAAVFLSILWSFNILSGFYLCVNKNNETFYTFNPYSNIAPKFWTRVSSVQFINKHWTLFQHPLEGNLNIFNNFCKYCKHVK